MKNSLDHTEYVNAEFFSLASQLYVRMRRLHGRVIDSVYMTQNPDYARAILRLAQTTADAEMSGLIQRIEKLVPAAASPVPVLDERINNKVEQDSTSARLSTNLENNYAQEETSHHYIGALR